LALRLNFLRDVGDTVALQRQRHSFSEPIVLIAMGNLRLPVISGCSKSSALPPREISFRDRPIPQSQTGLDWRRKCAATRLPFERLQKLAE
jgi:hypothetical protein